MLQQMCCWLSFSSIHGCFLLVHITRSTTSLLHPGGTNNFSVWRDIQVRTKDIDRVRRPKIVDTQALKKTTELGGSNIAAVGYHFSVAFFDIYGKVKQFSHHFLHLWHQSQRDFVVHDPETTPFLWCFSQFLILLLLLISIIVIFQFLHINHRDTRTLGITNLHLWCFLCSTNLLLLLYWWTKLQNNPSDLGGVSS